VQIKKGQCVSVMTEDSEDWGHNQRVNWKKESYHSRKLQSDDGWDYVSEGAEELK